MRHVVFVPLDTGTEDVSQRAISLALTDTAFSFLINKSGGHLKTFGNKFLRRFSARGSPARGLHDDLDGVREDELPFFQKENFFLKCTSCSSLLKLGLLKLFESPQDI